MNLSQWLDHIQRQHPSAIAMGLERVREVARRLRLTRPARHVISVAGTNGKGSTVAFLEAIARAAGLRVGAYTSPHLLHYNERVRIAGREAGDDELVSAFERVEAARVEGDAVPLTYFEYGTLAVLLLFERAGLDLAILEVGLGGRLDAVNIVDADAAIITTVDIDHIDWLGGDREAIGLEKAGILRAGRPAVLGEIDPPASVLRRAYALGASAIRAGCDYFVEPLPSGWRWREPGHAIDLPEPALAAPVQRANAAAAIAALRALDLDIPDAALREGVAVAALPGRLQRLQRGGVEIVLDVGHNPQAARELAVWAAAQPSRGRTLAVFSALADKDVAGLAAPLAPSVAHWFLAGLRDRSERGLDVRTLAQRLGDGLGPARSSLHEDVPAALAAALAAASAGDRVLVFGSFFTVGAALEALV